MKGIVNTDLISQSFMEVLYLNKLQGQIEI